jgi:hypothetical protein
MWGQFSRPLALLIIDRLRTINQAFARLAARIAAGKYVPRRPPDTPRRHEPRKPRGPNPLPQTFAWLIKLLPETAPFGGQLQALFAEPEMAALLAAAPAPLRRPLRSLCRMLGVDPPKILALPPPPPRPKPPPKPKIPKNHREAGFSPRRPMGRVRYLNGLRAPWPSQDST